MANKKIKDAEINPEDYEGSVSAMNTAKIVTLNIQAINLLIFIRTIYVIATGDFSKFKKNGRKQWNNSTSRTANLKLYFSNKERV